MATFLVEKNASRHRASSSGHGSTAKPPTRVEDFAEEVINGIFCTYEPPANTKALPHSKHESILRPSPMDRARSNDKNVRWIDDTDEDVEAAKKLKDQEKEQLKKQALTDTCQYITGHCMDVGVKAGILSNNSNGSLHQPGSEDDSNISLSRESKAHRNTMYDDEGNPVSVEPGDETPPPPPSAPPPNKREVFIPQLCGVELNCGEPSKDTIGSMEEHDDNSILANSDILSSVASATERAPPPPPPQPPAVNSGSPKKTEGGNKKAKKEERRAGGTWKDLRGRLESDDDWDGPDWMAEGSKSDDSAALEKKRADAIVRDRSDVSSSDLSSQGKDAEDDNKDDDNGDWDESVSLLSPQKRNRLNKKAKDKSLPTVEENEGMKLVGVEPAKKAAAKQENEENAPTMDSPNNQKKRSFFGRRKSGRDPSPGKPRYSDKTPDVAAAETETASGPKNSMSLKERFRRRNSDRSKSPSRQDRSKSPSRRFFSGDKAQSRAKKNLPPGLSWLSPTVKGNRGTATESAPMPHLHPAHPLNQVRQQVQMNSAGANMAAGYPYHPVAYPYPYMYDMPQQGIPADQASFITAHRRQVEGEQAGSQAGNSDYADRMSYITAHRNQIGMGQGAHGPSSDTGMSDYADRMSFITAHRNHIGQSGFDQGSQAGMSDYSDRMSFITAHRTMVGDVDRQSSMASDFDERMSYITATRDQPDGSVVGSAADDNVDRQSFIGDYRNMMEGGQALMMAMPPPHPQILPHQTQPPVVPEEKDESKDKKGDDEEKKEEDMSWEEKTRMAWERLRNGLGMSSEDQVGENGNDGKQTKEEENDVEDTTSSAEQQPAAGGGPAFHPTHSPDLSASREGEEVVTEDTLLPEEAAKNTEGDKETSMEATALSFFNSLIQPTSNESENEKREEETVVSSSSTQPSAPIKGILKTPSLVKKVTFGENDEKTFVPEEDEDVFEQDEFEEDDAQDENAPPPTLVAPTSVIGESGDEEKPELSVATGESSTTKSSPLQESPTVSNVQQVEKQNELPKLMLGEMQNKGAKPGQVVETEQAQAVDSKKKKKFRGGKFLANVLGKGKKKTRKPGDPRSSWGTSPSTEEKKDANDHSLTDLASKKTEEIPKTKPAAQNSQQEQPVVHQAPHVNVPTVTGGNIERSAVKAKEKPVPVLAETFTAPVVIAPPPPAVYYRAPSPMNGAGYYPSSDELSVQDRMMMQHHPPSIHDRLMQHHPPSIHDRLMQQHPPSIHDRLMMQQQQPSIHDQLLQQHQAQAYFYSHQPHAYNASMRLPPTQAMMTMPVQHIVPVSHPPPTSPSTKPSSAASI